MFWECDDDVDLGPPPKRRRVAAAPAPARGPLGKQPPKAVTPPSALARLRATVKSAARARRVDDDDAEPKPPTLAELSRPLPSTVQLAKLPSGLPLLVGSDCSGLLTESLALEILGVRHKHLFAAERNPVVRQLLYATYGKSAMVFYKNCAARDNTASAVPRVHLYVFGAPCQSFSPAGKRRGVDDSRGQVFFACLDYIKHKKPLAVVAENSAALATARLPLQFAFALCVIVGVGGLIEWPLVRRR
jgi:hypothetical protein